MSAGNPSRVGWALAVAAVTLLLLSSRVFAHAYVQESSPAEGATLAQPPAEIRIRYTEAIEVRFSKVSLLNGFGEPVGGTSQGAEGDRMLVLALPPLEQGAYTAQWQVLAKDGHVTEGTIRFSVGEPLTVARPAEPTVIGAPPVAPGGTPPEGRPAGFPWTWAGLGAVALLGLLGVLVWRRTRRGGA